MQRIIKLRNILFGYHYINGEIRIKEEEGSVVKNIYRLYLDGASMSEIAQILNNKNTEYKAGVVGWNKARIKRLLEDERYIGNKSYPPLVDRSIFSEIQQTISNRNVHHYTEKQTPLFYANIPVICPKCQSQMNRRCDHRYKRAIKWYCKNKDCRFMVAKEDNEFADCVGKILKRLADNPDLIEIEEPSDNVTIEDFSYGYSQGVYDKNTIRDKILTKASKIYSELENSICKSKRLQDLFRDATVTDEFPRELFDKAVTEVGLDLDGTVWVRLSNGNKIGEDEQECLKMNPIVL